MRKTIEYFVHYKDGDVDTVNWRTARRLAQNPSDDIDYIEKSIRYWDEDENLVDEKSEILYSSEAEWKKQIGKFIDKIVRQSKVKLIP
jgi:hypothetical protein